MRISSSTYARKATWRLGSKVKKRRLTTWPKQWWRKGKRSWLSMISTMMSSRSSLPSQTVKINVQICTDRLPHTQNKKRRMRLSGKTATPSWRLKLKKKTAKCKLSIRKRRQPSKRIDLSARKKIAHLNNSEMKRTKRKRLCNKPILKPANSGKHSMMKLKRHISKNWPNAH